MPARTPRNAGIVRHKEAPTTLIMVTFVDNAKRAGIVRKSFWSMIETTEHIDRDVMIWDNGSEKWWRRELLDLPVDYLCMSENVGITSAIYYALKVAPGKIVSITDDDVLFEPGWLEREMEILLAFPGVTTVCGYPVFHPIYEKNAAVIESNGVYASTYGGHVQFLGYKIRIQPFARPVGHYAAHRYKYFDQEIDDFGGLRLATPEPVVWHIGWGDGYK